MKPLVLSVCGDPGGARAIIPVLNELIKEDRVILENFAYIASVEVMQQSGFDVHMLDEKVSDEEEIEQIFQKYSPDLVLCATSMHELAFEKKFIQQAERQGIPSLAVLDFWSNYSMRFDDSDGNLKYLPSRIAVMDQFCKDEMISEGFPEDILEITGQPAFEQLEQKFSGKLTIDKGKVRSSQGLLARDLFVIFYSQPIRKYFAGTEDYPGFDEHTVLQDLLHILENRRSELDRPLFLGIIPHPTQKAEDFKNYLGKGSLVIDPLQASNELMFSADLILGMTSSRLMEASIAGCQVLSLQPDCLRCFKFPETSNGSVQVLTSHKEMNEKIFEMLKIKKEKVSKTVSKITYSHKEASKNIAKLIYDLLKINEIKMDNAGKEV